MTSAVWLARMPCFLNFWPWLMPFVPGGTTKLAWPRALSSGSTAATTTWTSAMPPFVIHVFVPFSTHSSVAASYSARVRRLATSLPASASLTAKAPVWSFSGVPKHSGTHSATCSGVPLPTIPDTARVDPKIERAMPASPQHSSSLTIGNVIPVGSPKALAMNSHE